MYEARGTMHEALCTRHEARGTMHEVRGTMHEARGTMHEALLEHGIDVLQKKRVDYGDIRYTEKTVEHIIVKNDHVEQIEQTSSHGIGIRVLLDGAWGFAATYKLDKKEVEDHIEKAIHIAKGSKTVSRDNVVLAPAEVYIHKYYTRYKKDPFKIPLEQKIELLVSSTKLVDGNENIKLRRAVMQCWKEKKIFLSTEGANIEQNFIECGAGLSVGVSDGKDFQIRSYPTSFGGNVAQRGYEFIEELKIPDNAEQTAKEALQIINSENCKKDKMDLILASDQLALQIHESCGHPTELDRVFGSEASYAGTSFLTPEKFNNFRYGSDKVTIVADATITTAIGGFAYDDEGIPAQRVELVKNGLFKGYLTSRETVTKFNRLYGQNIVPGGMMRAFSWSNIPLIRMTNISIEPGDWTLEELIKDTKKGIYMQTNRSWSIDDLRLNFQFGTEIAWLIENGELTRVVKNPIYSGITPEFWNSCDAVCNQKHFIMWGLTNCGKGEPSQYMHVAHGASPARFRNVDVGI